MYLKMNIHWIAIVFLAVIKSTDSQAQCSNTWVSYQNYNVLGGSLDQSASSLSGCQQSCITYPGCTGIDYDGAKRCWLIFGGNIVQNSNNQYVTHYELLRDVNSCTASCNGNRGWAWVAHVNKNAQGGTSNSAADSLAKCVKACIDSECAAIDWDVNNAGNQCWLFTSKPSSLQDAAKVVHYEKICSSSGIQVFTPNMLAPNQMTSVPYAIEQAQVETTVGLPAKSTTRGFIRPGSSTTRGFIPPGPSTTRGFIPPGQTTTSLTSSPAVVTSSGTFTTAQVLPTNEFTQKNSAADDTLAIHVKGQAIKPAYIVLIGLGAGCILLVILAVCTLCLYPLKGKGEDRYEAKKSKSSKSSKKQKGELHTRRPKTLSEEEHIGMSTVTTANRNSYEHNSYTQNGHHVSNGTVEKYEHRPQSDDYKRDSHDYNKRDSHDYKRDSDDYKKDTLEYNKRDSHDYNKRDSVGSIRKSGGYEEPFGHNDKESILEKGHDRVESFADDVKDNASYLHEEYD